MKVYIAGPFFSKEQKETINKIERLLKARDTHFYSPMRDGVIGEMEKPNFDLIYKNNVDNVADCTTMIAVIDDRDMGTIFEMGYAAALGKDIITYSSKDYGLNVMIERCVRYHARSIGQVSLALADRVISNTARITS